MRTVHPASPVDRRRLRLQATLLRLLAGAFLLGVLALAFLGGDARAAEPLLRFEDGIGSQPWARNAQGQLIPNDVSGVNPGGRPWVIARLSADVGADGRIRVDGRGLLLAGGNNIGRTGDQSVRARLICAGVFHDSELVPLDPRGDFRIGGFLNPIPPSPCASPVLLIVSGGGAWFAAGIPK